MSPPGRKEDSQGGDQQHYACQTRAPQELLRSCVDLANPARPCRCDWSHLKAHCDSTLNLTHGLSHCGLLNPVCDTSTAG